MFHFFAEHSHVVRTVPFSCRLISRTALTMLSHSLEHGWVRKGRPVILLRRHSSRLASAILCWRCIVKKRHSSPSSKSLVRTQCASDNPKSANEIDPGAMNCEPSRSSEIYRIVEKYAVVSIGYIAFWRWSASSFTKRTGATRVAEHG